MISVLLFSVAASACAPVHDSVLRARDLAAVDARFAAAPPEEVIGYAPAPGSRRVFAEAEMTRFARRFAIEGVARPVCFAYAMKPLDRAGALAAIVQAIPGVEAEILDAPRFPVPDGRIVFPLNALPKPPAFRMTEPIVWRGYIEYAEGRRFTIWASVRLSVTRQRVFAMADLPIGHTVGPGDVEVRTVSEFPDSPHWAETTADAVEHRMRRAVQAGMRIPANAIEPSIQAVGRGDEVRVEVAAGGARLQIDARAEGSAVLGGMVKLRNPKSGKVFEARVTGKGTASVITQAVTPEETK
jgi:flagella basal body P-ring formation protein FlgA